MRFVGVRRRTPARAAWRGPRRPAMPRPARGPARTAPARRRERRTVVPPWRTTWRQASTTSACEASNASTSSSRRVRSSPLRQEPRGRRVEQADGALDLGDERRNAGLRAARPRAGERRARRPVRNRRIAMPATTSSCAVRDAGGNGAGSSGASMRSASSRWPTSSRRRTSRWRAWAAFSRSPRRSSVARAALSALVGPAELARHERDLGLGHDAARARHRLPRAEGARRALDQAFCTREIAELRHGDAAQRQGRRVVAESDPVQRAERITRRQRARRGRDQRVHRIPPHL